MNLAKFYHLVAFIFLLKNISNVYIKEIFQQVRVFGKDVRMSA